MNTTGLSVPFLTAVQDKLEKTVPHLRASKYPRCIMHVEYTSSLGYTQQYTT
jgi:hypothetical protein